MSACGHFCRYEELKKQLAEAQDRVDGARQEVRDCPID